MEKTHAREIKCICESFLHQVQVPIQFLKSDATFYADCCREATSRGVDATSILPYLRVGCGMAEFPYAHLGYETRVFVALYTAAAVGTEDTCKSDMELLKNFSHRLIRGKKHGNPILDTYDMLLWELAERFEPFAAEAMFQSALDLCVGLVLEHEVQKKPVCHVGRFPVSTIDEGEKAVARPGKEFPSFLRDLTGASRLYTTMIFTDEIPLRTWMEAIPALIDYVQYVNDILSFYKEELVDETNNFISVKARSSGKTKIGVLRCLADQTAETYEEIIAVLSHNPAALEAFKAFSKGYVDFHFSCERYKIADLWRC